MASVLLQALKILNDDMQCDVIKIGGLVRNKVSCIKFLHLLTTDLLHSVAADAYRLTSRPENMTHSPLVLSCLIPFYAHRRNL